MRRVPFDDFVSVAVGSAHDPHRLVPDPDLADTRPIARSTRYVSGSTAPDDDDLAQPERRFDHQLIARAPGRR